MAESWWGGGGVAQQCGRDILGGGIGINLLVKLNCTDKYIYIGISEGGEFWVNGRYICIYIYLAEGGGWDLTKQLGNVIIIMLGLVGLFN